MIMLDMLHDDYEGSTIAIKAVWRCKAWEMMQAVISSNNDLETLLWKTQDTGILLGVCKQLYMLIDRYRYML